MASADYLKSNRWPDTSRSDSAQTPSRQLAVRIGAVLALGFIAVVTAAEVTELRGELAFARFLLYRRLARECVGSETVKRFAEHVPAEIDLIMTFAKGDPDALTEVTTACVEWSGNKELDPALCLRLGDTAVQAALLAVYAAPSDYERWVWLAYAQSVLGLKKQAEICLKRAQELAPPGKKLELFAGKG